MSRHKRSKSRSKSRSPNDYREECERLERVLKRRKRDIEETSYHMGIEMSILRKANQDKDDLWRIYDTLQKELAAAYERNGKLTGEKKKVQVDIAKADLAVGGTGNVEQLRLAVTNLRKERDDIQERYDKILNENNELNKRNSDYKQKLDEMDALRDRLKSVIDEMHSLGGSVASMDHSLTMARFNREAIDKFRTWNGALSAESEFKERKVCRVLPLVFGNVPRRQEQWRKANELKDRIRKVHATYQTCRQRRQTHVSRLAHTAKTLRTHWLTAAACINEELAAVGHILDTSNAQLDTLAAQVPKLEETETGETETKEVITGLGVCQKLRTAVENIDEQLNGNESIETDKMRTRKALDDTLQAVQMSEFCLPKVLGAVQPALSVADSFEG